MKIFLCSPSSSDAWYVLYPLGTPTKIQLNSIYTDGRSRVEIIAILKVPVRSNFPKFMFVDFSKVYVAVTYLVKPFFNPSTRSPFFFHGISRILRPPLIDHVPTAQ